MARQLDVSLFRKVCPDALGASYQESPEPTVHVSTSGNRSGVDIRAAFRRCYGVDVRRVLFVRGLEWPADGWCDQGAALADGSPEAPFEYVYTQPSGPLEQALAKFWEELLEVPEVGASDDFWEHGGDSLGAVETIEFLAQEYGARIGFFDIGDNFTVARLAALVHERSRP
ncbi:phosphopantetheine-binding protein [Kitasatospora sp. NBC_01250]|uniref:phosphopantetheine-binding protein n=1 Tax=Kitasatospora sp. NBC_01250 TaxID=2903571 RepID=UPI002E35F80A|nr:phosphopantetheine-binding protein [Kitasatospora sp. NBC_01250]